MPDEFKVAAEAVAAAATTKAKANTATPSAPSTSTSTTSTTPPATPATKTSGTTGKEGDSEEEWIEGYDPKNKRKYYVNKHTGESRWTKPLDQKQVIADDWISGRDPKTKRVYYYNKRTKETTWEKPPGYTEPGNDQKSENTEDAKSIISQVNATKTTPLQPKPTPLPTTNDSPSLKALKEKAKAKDSTKLWISGTDPKTGKTYYYNTATKATTWTKPSDVDLNKVTKKSSAKRRASIAMQDVDQTVKKGIVKQRRSSIVNLQPKVFDTTTSTASEAERLIRDSKKKKASFDNGQPKKSHRRTRSTADDAQAIIRLAKEKKALEEAAMAAMAAVAEEEEEEVREGDMIMTSPSIDNLPRSNNVVELQFLKLLHESEKDLQLLLLNHRKHIGGLSTAPLSDIIDAFAAKDGGGEHSLAPYMEGGDKGHLRSGSSLM